MSYPAYWLIIIIGSYGTTGKAVDHVPFPTLALCEAAIKHIDERHPGEEKTLLCVQANSN